MLKGCPKDHPSCCLPKYFTIDAIAIQNGDFLWTCRLCRTFQGITGFCSELQDHSLAQEVSAITNGEFPTQMPIRMAIFF
ncbi:hypothetical protein Hanom_Chr10g00960181 [Helianthus anomalus]